MNLLEISQPSDSALFETFSQNTEGYDINDLVLIAREYLLEAKKSKMPASTTKSNVGNVGVVFKETELWKRTSADKLKHKPMLQNKIDAFKQSKLNNKLQPFGQGDSLFGGNGPIGKNLPSLRHAHITPDISIVYDLSGSNPTVITLYGLFTHDDIGTGQPKNPNKQLSFVKAMKSI